MIPEHPPADLRPGWEVRRAVFGDRIEFVRPQTTPVSLTGGQCELMCAHCQGHYLKSMARLGQPLEGKSLLVSGGSDRSGALPIRENLEQIASWSREYRVNLHTGLIDPTLARELARLELVVSFDFLIDEETIRSVYGLENGRNRVLSSFHALLDAGIQVVPHICIGLLGGEIRGEWEALEYLVGTGIRSLSLLVFRPTRGTPLEASSPPPVEDVVSLIHKARLYLPQTPLHLGCMRPGGSYRQRLDPLAVASGVNRLVQPAPKAREAAQVWGLEVGEREECCAL